MTSEPINVVYITGYGRSGSTLLDRMLGSIDGILSCGELEKVWVYGCMNDYFCTCGKTFGECDFWSEVLSSLPMANQPSSVSEILRLKESVRVRRLMSLFKARLLKRPLPNDCTKYLSIWSGLLSSLRRCSGAKVIVDSSKAPHLIYALSLAPDINVHVIQLVRDSRAVAYSYGRLKVTRESVSRTRYIKRSSPLAASLSWLSWNIQAELFSRTAMGITRIRYEDLVSDPQRELDKIFAALGWPRQQLRFVTDAGLQLGPAHMVGGNPMRFQQGTIPLELDDEWRTRMSFARKLLVTMLTFPLLVRYGYALSTRWGSY